MDGVYRDFERCNITIYNHGCPRCTKRFDEMSSVKGCNGGWNVCGDCYPKYCVAFRTPENKTPTLGAMKLTLRKKDV